MNSNYWQNKVCVVTGASAGLGRAIAAALARRGAKVVLVARQKPPLIAATDTLTAAGADVMPIVADVTSQTDVDRLAQAVDDKYGAVDLVCNCAGRSTRGALLDTLPEQFQELLEVNFLAAVRTTRAFATTLLQQRGHVVNIGSLASKVAPRFLGGYPASKFALSAYSQQLRLELGPQGLHVMLVCPGPIRRAGDAPRYSDEVTDLPAEAARPGGGSKLRGLDADWLAEKILAACERRQLEVVVPWRARILFVLSAFSPRLGDWLLRKFTAG